MHRRPTVIQRTLYKAEKIKLFKQIYFLVIQPYKLATVHYSVRIYTCRWLPYLVIKTYLQNVPLPRLTFKLPSPLHCNKQLAQSQSLPTPTAHRHSISDVHSPLTATESAVSCCVNLTKKCLYLALQRTHTNSIKTHTNPDRLMLLEVER